MQELLEEEDLVFNQPESIRYSACSSIRLTGGPKSTIIEDNDEDLLYCGT